jgi:hypothetical protein
VTGSLVLAGCGARSSYVKSDTTLGRVVVYRNGVAYFERYAELEGGSLKLAVPGDKVDDFLKSLTVVDAKTGAPAPVSYPSATSGEGTIEMKVNLGGPAPHKVKLTYVTEAPSWKPSYRVELGNSGKMGLQAWAIVDNTSGEDWNAVKLGVGSSSAMSFRFDLRSLRVVQRQTLHSEDLFAQAPPTGAATYGQPKAGQPGAAPLTLDLSEDAIASQRPREEPIAARPESVSVARKSSSSRGVHAGVASGLTSGATPRSAEAAPAAPPPAQAPEPPNPGDAQMRALANRLRNSSNQVVIEGYATAGDADKYAASLERANRVRDQLVRSGLDANRIVALGKGEQAGRAGGVRVVEQEDTKAKEQAAAGARPNVAAADSGDPVGTSHFESGSTMNVPRGTSAMVSILNAQTDGQVVYLYDAESPRGNAMYPFKALRFRNPTDSALEQGPVTVFGEGRFIGEGLAEPIPARSVAFVPFALDRQIVVERKDAEHEEIARILSVVRGVFSTEVKHTKKSTFALHNRTGEKVTVFIRHTVPAGFKLAHGPTNSERIGGAHLFKVELEPRASTDVVIEEATPVFKSTDIRTPAGLDLVKVYLSSAAVEGPLKTAVADLLKLHQDMSKLEEQVATLREQMGEYRARMDELHAQIVTLRAVKTAGPIMGHLEKKLQEVSDKLSHATVDLVGLQEKQMVARVRFQDGVAELSLEKADDKRSAAGE